MSMAPSTIASCGLEADIRNSGMGLYARIIGWLSQGWSIAEYRHHYASNFGLGGAESDYSLILFEISFGTSSWAASGGCCFPWPC